MSKRDRTTTPASDASATVAAISDRCMLDSAHPMVRTAVLDAVRDLLILAAQSPAHARAVLAAWRDAHGV